MTRNLYEIFMLRNKYKNFYLSHTIGHANSNQVKPIQTKSSQFNQTTIAENQTGTHLFTVIERF
jgi:hypothetical protein